MQYDSTMLVVTTPSQQLSHRNKFIANKESYFVHDIERAQHGTILVCFLLPITFQRSFFILCDAHGKKYNVG